MNKVLGKVVVLGCAGVLAVALAGCGSSEPAKDGATQSAQQEQPKQEQQEEKAQPLDLTGAWEQANKNSEDSYHTATIGDGVITVEWTTDGGATQSVYWAGTYVAPTEAADSYTWESAGDTEQMSQSMLGSGDESKVFTYENGVLTYEFTAMGTTMTVEMERR